MGLRDALTAVMESRPVQEMFAEAERMVVQGRAEAANALFNGSAFVPYGEGQRAAEEPQQTGPALDAIMRQQPQPPEVQKEVQMEMER